MITIQGNIAFLINEQKRFPRHRIKRLVRIDKQWRMSLER